MDRSTTIRESRSLAGRFRGGRLQPVMQVAFKGGEGGVLNQTAMVELDPIAGRLLTPITAQMIAIYAPVQAMAALDNPSDPFAGVTEVIRQRGLDGDPIFGLEDENTISKLCGIMPVSIGGVKKVSSVSRLAHNCAVNYLRKRLYTYAAEVTAANVAVTPALLSSTVLSRFNGVLNPDDHVGGFIPFDPAGEVPVKGIGFQTVSQDVSNAVVRESGSTTTRTYPFSHNTSVEAANAVSLIEKTGASGFPNIRVELDEAVGAGIRLTDMYNAERMDDLTRRMRGIIDANPVDGEDQIVRWAHGLSVDTGQNCWLLSSSETIFGQDFMRATDGAGIEAEVTQSRMAVQMRFTVPVPRTELGGVVVTFLVVKPDEVLFEQPHPVLAAPWVFDNLLAEELQNDPVPVLAREIQAGVAAGSESTVCFYTGYNELRRLYVNYGWNRATDPATVDAKNAMWLYEIPASVTPENIVYPPDIPHYPFLDQDADVARYQIMSSFTAVSPIYIGPSPVEEVSVISSEDLFEQEGV